MVPAHLIFMHLNPAVAKDASTVLARIQRFTDVLRRINRDQDPTLAWNSSCEHAQCGSCSVVINDMPLLACELLVENAVQ